MRDLDAQSLHFFSCSVLKLDQKVYSLNAVSTLQVIRDLLPMVQFDLSRWFIKMALLCINHAVLFSDKYNQFLWRNCMLTGIIRSIRDTSSLKTWALHTSLFICSENKLYINGSYHTTFFVFLFTRVNWAVCGTFFF